jgi:hypothetical protein
MLSKNPLETLTNHWNNWIKKTVDIAFWLWSYHFTKAARVALAPVGLVDPLGVV